MYQILNDDEIKKFLATARLRDPRDYTMSFLAISTGLRCSELIGLFVEDVAPYGDISTILIVPERIGKRNVKREIPITHETRTVLKAWLDIRSTRDSTASLDSFLFISHHTHKPLSSRDFQRIVKDISIRSIGRPITPHILRHTFATRILKQSNTRVVQVLLGHARIQTTEIYTHINSEDTRSAVDKVLIFDK